MHKVFAVSLSIIVASMIYFGVLFPHAMSQNLNLEFRTGSVIVVMSSVFFYMISEQKYQAGVQHLKQAHTAAHYQRELELREQNLRVMHLNRQPTELKDYIRIAML